jgi:hypothetical protein
MQEIWNAYGFYLWAMTTALVLIALAWLAYNTFTGQGDDETASAAHQPTDPAALQALADRIDSVAEATPHIQATLGRSLQHFGMVRYADGQGAQAFSLALANARGDGFVLSSSIRGGMSVKPMTQWVSSQPFSLEEQSAIDQARGLRERV